MKTLPTSLSICFAFDACFYPPTGPACACLLRRGHVEEDAEDFLIHRESIAEWSDGGGIAFKNYIHEKAGGVLLIGHAHEILFIHLLDRFDLAAGRSDLRRDLINDVLHP